MTFTDLPTSAPRHHAARPTLADPLALGPKQLRNRFVSAPMERNYCEIDGTITDRYIDYLVRRARGGSALVFTEASYVRADGKGRLRQLGVDVDERVPGLARLTAAIHAEDALVGVELNHGGRTAQGAVTGYQPVAPSPIPCEVVGGQMPLELDTDEIHDLVQCYADAAGRCRTAGVDVISLHGGHGYLIHQFLSPAYNHRTDEFADPVRFVNLVINAVRAAAPGLAVGLRLSAFEGIDGGLDAEGTLERMRRVNTGSLDFLDVSAGNYEAGQWIVQPGEWRRGLLAPYASAYREFGVPVGVAGRINSPDAAAAILADNQADFVSMARTLHADPDFPTRALQGKRFRPCIACNYCIDNLGSGEPIPCTVNPWVGRESEQPQPRPTGTGPTVRVIGAGPAGLSTARELALAGARVEVYDGRHRTGGDFASAAELHEYPEYHHLLDWYDAELADLGVTVHLEHTVTADELSGWDNADAVVVASGGQGFDPAITVTGRNVQDVRDWLLTQDRADPPSDAVVYGADREGAAAADDLAARGTRVTLVGPQETIAEDVGRRAKIVLLPRLHSHPLVRIQLGRTLVRATADRLVLRDAQGGQQSIEAAGPLLISVGMRPRRDLLEACRGLAPQLGVYTVGDASGDGGSVHAANLTATRVAAQIMARYDEVTPHRKQSIRKAGR